MNVKENQKFQSTHREIMDALLELLQEKDIKHVTVSELCRRVHINRSTFYEHFLDVYDVLEKIVEDITSEAAQTMPPKPSREEIIALFCHIRRHREFYTLYFRQGLPLDVQQRFFLSLPPRSESDDPEKLKELGITSEAELDYMQAMFAASMSALLRRWLERGCDETPEELFEILQKEFWLRKPE